MGIEILSVVTLLANGLVAGVLFGVAMANVPGFGVMGPAQYVAAHQLFDRHYEPAMPLLVAVAAVADVVLVFGVGGVGRAVLFALSALALVGVAAVSQFANVPLLRSVRGADADALPEDWPDPRPAWRRWHLVRTAFATVALTATAVAAAT
jgi:uncharacterized membrane protein